MPNSLRFPTPLPATPRLGCAPDASPLPGSDAAIDRQLVQRFTAGDEQAFVEIMARHRHKIFALTFGLLRNHADAEEITQDTFLRVHRGLAGFRGDSSFATWIHRIAVNLSRNRYWFHFRRRRQDTLSLDFALNGEGSATFNDLLADRDRDPAQHSAASEFSHLVDICMARLEPRHREILTLRNVLDRSYAQIADSLGVRIGTVKSRIARARESLRTLLAETCPEFAPHAKLGGWFPPSRAPAGAALSACA